MSVSTLNEQSSLVKFTELGSQLLSGHDFRQSWMQFLWARSSLNKKRFTSRGFASSSLLSQVKLSPTQQLFSPTAQAWPAQCVPIARCFVRCECHDLRQFVRTYLACCACWAHVSQITTISQAYMRAASINWPVTPR